MSGRGDGKSGERMGLWRLSGREDAEGGKYLVLHRGDGSVLRHPCMVWGARDPAAPAGLLAYADAARETVMTLDGRERSFVGSVGSPCWAILRRDGSVPEWPGVVLHAMDPCAPAALRAYARESERLGADPRYARDVATIADDFDRYFARELTGRQSCALHVWCGPLMGANERENRMLSERYQVEVRMLSVAFETYRASFGDGDPDAVPHRRDNAEVVALMKQGQSV